MARGIVDLIQENKRRFYRGEIGNYFYEEPYLPREKRNNSHILDNASIKEDQVSMWQNLKTFGQKFSEDLFYEPAK